MGLTICSEVAAADWIVTSEVPWPRLVTFGPAGFAAYARIRFIPDPTRERQKETDAGPDATPDEVEQWRSLLQLLADNTTDPDDCYFGLWEGWGFPASARRWPTFAIPRGAHPPMRAYFLFHGSLSEAARWGGGAPARSGIWEPSEFSGGGAPAFVWPSDQKWCVAADIDPHWAAIGASVPLIERVLGDRGLDAVAADAADPQPAYR